MTRGTRQISGIVAVCAALCCLPRAAFADIKALEALTLKLNPDPLPCTQGIPDENCIKLDEQQKEMLPKYTKVHENFREMYEKGQAAVGAVGATSAMIIGNGGLSSVDKATANVGRSDASKIAFEGSKALMQAGIAAQAADLLRIPANVAADEIRCKEAWEPEQCANTPCTRGGEPPPPSLPKERCDGCRATKAETPKKFEACIARVHASGLKLGAKLASIGTGLLDMLGLAAEALGDALTLKGIAKQLQDNQRAMNDGGGSDAPSLSDSGGSGGSSNGYASYSGPKSSSYTPPSTTAFPVSANNVDEITEETASGELNPNSISANLNPENLSKNEEEKKHPVEDTLKEKGIIGLSNLSNLKLNADGSHGERSPAGGSANDASAENGGAYSPMIKAFSLGDAGMNAEHEPIPQNFMGSPLSSWAHNESRLVTDSDGKSPLQISEIISWRKCAPRADLRTQLEPNQRFCAFFRMAAQKDCITKQTRSGAARGAESLFHCPAMRKSDAPRPASASPVLERGGT